jgi:hypothetical protein
VSQEDRSTRSARDGRPGSRVRSRLLFLNAAICREFVDRFRIPGADLLSWIAGICRGYGPRKTVRGPVARRRSAMPASFARLTPAGKPSDERRPAAVLSGQLGEESGAPQPVVERRPTALTSEGRAEDARDEAYAASGRGLGDPAGFAPTRPGFAPELCSVLPAPRRIREREFPSYRPPLNGTDIPRRRVRPRPQTASLRSAPAAMRPSSNTTSVVVMRWSPKGGSPRPDRSSPVA